MPLEPKICEASKRHPSRTASLPLPPPCQTHPINFASSASLTLFTDSVPPEYSKYQEDIDPPSFSQAVLTIDPTWSFIQPVTSPSDESIPLYAISTGLNEDRNHIRTIQRLYHKFSDSPGSSSKGAKAKSTALPVYDIGPGRTRCELKPLLESANYSGLVHAEKHKGHGVVMWEFNVLVERTQEDQEATTKNELVRGKTEIITRRVFLAQSKLGDEGAVEWIDEDDVVVAYGLQLGRKRRPNMRSKSEAVAEYVEVIDRSLVRERSPKEKGKSSKMTTESDDGSKLHMELPMPSLNVVKPLERNKME